MQNQMPDLLMELVDLGGRHAHSILIEKGEPALMPCYLLMVPSGDAVLIPCPWGSQEEKDFLIDMVKQTSHEIGAIAASFVAEAWVVRVKNPPKGQELDAAFAAALPVRENPNRMEVVEAVATDGRRTVARVWHMLRDKPGGKLMQLVQLHDSDSAAGDKMEGRLTDGLIRPR